MANFPLFYEHFPYDIVCIPPFVYCPKIVFKYRKKKYVKLNLLHKYVKLLPCRLYQLYNLIFATWPVFHRQTGQ